jgi:hypothetical protein
MTWNGYEGVELRKRVHMHLCIIGDGGDIFANNPSPKLAEALQAKPGPKVCSTKCCAANLFNRHFPLSINVEEHEEIKHRDLEH